MKRFSAARMFWILLLFLDVPASLGCGGGQQSYYYYPSADDATLSTKKRRRTRKITDAVDRNLPDAWGGFMPPPEVEAVWRDWLDRFNKLKENDKKHHDPSRYESERGPGSGWPAKWQGIAAGSSGVEAPPWAYLPIDTGLPSFCSEPPLLGTCDEEYTRWAFNPFIAQCVEFEYSGCNGNQNNFLSMQKCEQSCMKMPVNGCNPKKKQFVEYYMTP